jgi:hypothetical protein
MPRPSSRRLTPWVTVAALVLLAGGAATASTLTSPAGSLAGSASPSTSTTILVPPTGASPPVELVPPATPPPLTVSSTVPPLLPPPGALTTTIELPSTTLVAGSTVNGSLVVTNHTNETFNLTQGCRPNWVVGLQSGSVRFVPGFTLECGGDPFFVPPGVSRLPFKLTVTYQGCSMDPQAATADFPACISGDQMPPLPPGAYEAVLVSGTSALSAPPVDVQVVAPSGQS